jgi:CspA family cold shock protein
MSDETQTPRLVGKVKWFNNKAGYGFITASEGELAGKDVFVHYSTINVSNPQYKYLVQGEYVEFELVKSQNDKHEFQATNVSGIKGGSIMCETRSTSTRMDSSDERPVRSYRPPLRRRPAPRREPVDNADDGFVTIEKRNKRRVPKNDA